MVVVEVEVQVVVMVVVQVLTGQVKTKATGACLEGVVGRVW